MQERAEHAVKERPLASTVHAWSERLDSATSVARTTRAVQRCESMGHGGWPLPGYGRRDTGTRPAIEQVRFGPPESSYIARSIPSWATDRSERFIISLTWKTPVTKLETRYDRVRLPRRSPAREHRKKDSGNPAASG